ncbi:TetR/AcrR family transcriptional regulator [Conexibacter arvalis]|uniref:AcrR family transcriptional regulator n=1 Tax=Conexibacter arvalis TaxID=912552 RepID=A0A840I6N7_9ACTN|nr:TetR/AcrR family transcriptional regulator [Conexibacter arvalis]MBB4660517.1 AcrR family transcriptional regulator [Conexibacter arvalis]
MAEQANSAQQGEIAVADDTRRTVRRRGRRREILLAEAARLFYERGYGSVGIDEIGDAAGISGPAVYKHFPSKQAILAAVIEQALERVREHIDEALAEPRPPQEQLAAFLRSQVEAAFHVRHVIPLGRADFAHLDPPDQQRLRREMRLILQEWSHLIVETRPELSEAEARALALGAQGLIHFMIRMGDSLDRERLAQRAFEAAHGALQPL